MDYVGIDLGTTNSAICSFDGEEVRVYRSPDFQQPITPSAIYVDRRTRYYGQRACDKAAFSPDNVAVNFKRFMGSDTPVAVPGAELVLSPEECSAEILRYLYSYLPEGLRASEQTGTVITIPAAFNQMQRDATLKAAEMAGIGRVALMQEPVAAVMSVMRTGRRDGIFLVYDFGGGTFDIAVAQSVGGHVSLLEHDGIDPCGGRDFDRSLVERIVIPWLRSHFKLPASFSPQTPFGRLLKLASWAAEKAKIELSRNKTALISLSEDEARLQDLAGQPIYLDIPLERATLEELSRERIDQTIEATKLALSKASVSAEDIDRIVFIGGPTQFKALRDYVCSQLGIPGDTKVDPMTAVAEGAAVFAESVDWNTSTRVRKSSDGAVSVAPQLGLSFEFTSRTPNDGARIIARCNDCYLSGEYFQIDNLDNGWSSGRLKLSNQEFCDVSLPKMGLNTFKVSLVAAAGVPVALKEDRIVITRTAACVQAIPASHSVGVEVKEGPFTSATRLRFLVNKGDALPKRGREVFRAAQELHAGGNGALIFKLYEGQIPNPVTDNRFVGCFKIRGSEIDSGSIKVGDELICEYEASDSGRLSITISAPSVGGTFIGQDLYSRQESQLDYTRSRPAIEAEAERTLDKIQRLELRVQDRELARARQKLHDAHRLLETSEQDPEAAKDAYQKVLEARSMLSGIRTTYLAAIRQAELDRAVEVFNKVAREDAKPSEESAFDNMIRTAERLISNSSGEFDNVLDEMQSCTWSIVWRDDGFVTHTFERFAQQPYLFPDQDAYRFLVQKGGDELARSAIEELRQTVLEMYRIKASTSWSDEINLSNIM